MKATPSTQKSSSNKTSKSPMKNKEKKEAELYNPRKLAQHIVSTGPSQNINQRMTLDCLICLSYIYFDWREWKDSKAHF